MVGAKALNSSATGRGRKHPRTKKAQQQQETEEKSEKRKRELFIESGVSDDKGGEPSDTGEEGGSVELEEKVFQKV